MLTVICPNCRHRFPAAGCCEPATIGMQEENGLGHPADSFYGGLLVPRGYASNSGCFVNAPTIVQGPAIIQTGQQCCSASSGFARRTKPREDPLTLDNLGYRGPAECHITTTCDLTGGSVTITTPGIQSGGFLIHSTDSGIQVQPHIEIRPKLSGGGGGVVVQKRLSTEDEDSVNQILVDDDRSMREIDACCCATRKMQGSIPSGCQELPGIRRSSPSKMREEETAFESCRMHHTGLEVPLRGQQGHRRPCRDQTHRPLSSGTCCNSQNLCDGHARSNSLFGGSTDDFSKCLDNGETSSFVENANGLQIQVNATVQLPANLGQCTLNITASTANNSNQSTPGVQKNRNNFHGGGLVRQDSRITVPNVPAGINAGNVNSNERRDGAPSTPVSWLMPCPWGFDSCLADKDESRLREVRRLLQTCGWYHEGLSWQQSENLLKDAPVGRWLMRDSSDSRYTFAVSVQTTRGPTSVRVHYFLGQFRLDAEPRLALAMPAFDCPIKMLEYYVDYSKRIDEKEQVWVDYSGQVYSQIYLTKPLVKEVRSLSHLARLAINRNKLLTEHLPPIIRNYLAEYPYTL